MRPAIAKRKIQPLLPPEAVVQGRRRDIGLGGAQLVSLADARDKAFTLRKVARSGGDPVAEKAQPRVPTFAEAARSAHTEHVAAWRSTKHAAQWISTLHRYAFPSIGARRVDQIETPDVLKVLSSIWLSKPETARRVKQRIGTVLDWAKAAGFRAGENPVHGVAKGLPRQPERKRHHATLPFTEVPSFVRKLRASDAGEPTKLAFEFLILTAARTKEALEAQWSELKNEVWTVPPERMKAKREHRVPLAPRCLQILRRAKELSDGSAHVFPGNSVGKPLSNMVFLMTLRRMGSFASAYGGNRDLAVECVIEGDAVAQAIRALMARRQAWTGTATDLLRDLSNAVDDRTHNDKRWPKDPKALSGRLRRAATFLRNFGIEITFDRVGRERTRTVNIRVQPGPDNDGIEASAASAASAAPRKARPTRGLVTTSLWTLGNDADALKD